MPKKKLVTRRRKQKKLQKGAIYTLFALLLLGSSIVSFASFTKSSSILLEIDNRLTTYFGSLRYFFPFLPLLLSLLMFRMKFFLSRAHLSIGFIILFIGLLGFSESGHAGISLYTSLSTIVGGAGASLIFFSAVFVGMVVFFDMSMDDILQGTKVILGNFTRFFPTFKKGEPGKILNKEKETPFVIKGNTPKEEKEQPLRAMIKEPEPIMIKKEHALISDKLVSNTPSSTAWEYPPLSLLSDAVGQKAERGDVKKTASIIEKTLESFGIAAHVREVNLGPAVTQYALEIALGTKVSKITSLANDLALATEAPTGQIRIEAPIPGRSLVGIEIPNRSLEVVPLRTMLASQKMQKNKGKLVVSLGLDVAGEPAMADITKMPHILIAGTTGSGKSVSLNSFIVSILFRASPQEVRFIMIDPKRVEMTVYNGIPHLLTPVIVEADKILSSLKWAVNEMERRYKIFAEKGVRNIESYNELLGFQELPFIIVMIDELADLMSYAPVEVEDAIARLAQMARATGIHLVIATQRPSVDVITGLIKANVPCRIAFSVSSMTDSRVILDSPGAEKLLGRGDMLFVPPDQAKASRIQGTFISEKDIKKVVDFLKERNPVVNYTEEITQQQVSAKKPGMGGTSEGGDQFMEDAIRVLCQYDRASASLLQRKLSIGYSRAARILDQLEEMGVVGPAEGSKPRDVLVQNADEFIASLHQE